MQMVGSCDHDSIDVLLLVQHRAEIRITRCLVEFLLESDSFRAILFLIILQFLRYLGLGIREIHICEGDEILRLRQVERVLRAHSSKSNDRKVDRVTGRLKADSAQYVSNHEDDTETDFS